MCQSPLPPPSGAVPSGTFPGPSLSTTNSTTDGGAAVAPTCTANGVCGIYNLSANFSTLSASFSCTNLPTFNAATLAGLTNVYTTPAFSLATRTGAQSPGGTFSGAGVSGGNFDPATAGMGAARYHLCCEWSTGQLHDQRRRGAFAGRDYQCRCGESV